MHQNLSSPSKASQGKNIIKMTCEYTNPRKHGDKKLNESTLSFRRRFTCSSIVAKSLGSIMSHINLRTVVPIDKLSDSVCLLIYQILEILLF